MIAEVTGVVRSLAPDGLVLAVGGVGLAVQCTPGTLAALRIGGTTMLATALVVREDSLTLYGFADADERSLFETLQTATGVGPRLAQAVLGVLRPDAVRRAIATEDLGALCAVPGVGRRLAQRLVLELKDRVGAPDGLPAAARNVPPSVPRTEARAALLSLGYAAREADQALTGLEPAADGTERTADVLRAALSLLRRG